MKAAIYGPVTLLFAVLFSTAGAHIIKHATEQDCARGDWKACRILELAKKIDFRMFDEGADYKLASGPGSQWAVVSAMTDKTQIRRQFGLAACTFYNE